MYEMVEGRYAQKVLSGKFRWSTADGGKRAEDEYQMKTSGPSSRRKRP